MKKILVLFLFANCIFSLVAAKKIRNIQEREKTELRLKSF